MQICVVRFWLLIIRHGQNKWQFWRYWQLKRKYKRQTCAISNKLIISHTQNWKSVKTTRSIFWGPLTTTTFFSPALVAFWVVVIVLPSRVTTVLQWRPSVVSSSNSSPILKHQTSYFSFWSDSVIFSDLNFSSILLTVVLVTIVQLPPSSEMVITGVEARAAFLRMNPTPRAFRNSSYFSHETCVYVPVMGAIFGAARLVSGCAVRWYSCSQPEGWHGVYTLGEISRDGVLTTLALWPLHQQTQTGKAQHLKNPTHLTDGYTHTHLRWGLMLNMDIVIECTFYHHVNNQECVVTTVPGHEVF